MSPLSPRDAEAGTALSLSGDGFVIGEVDPSRFGTLQTAIEIVDGIADPPTADVAIHPVSASVDADAPRVTVSAALEFRGGGPGEGAAVEFRLGQILRWNGVLNESADGTLTTGGVEPGVIVRRVNATRWEAELRSKARVADLYYGDEFARPLTDFGPLLLTAIVDGRRGDVAVTPLGDGGKTPLGLAGSGIAVTTLVAQRRNAGDRVTVRGLIGAPDGPPAEPQPIRVRLLGVDVTIAADEVSVRADRQSGAPLRWSGRGTTNGASADVEIDWPSGTFSVRLRGAGLVPASPAPGDEVTVRLDVGAAFGVSAVATLPTASGIAFPISAPVPGAKSGPGARKRGPWRKATRAWRARRRMRGGAR